jgi:hypothetical protein
MLGYRRVADQPIEIPRNLLCVFPSWFAGQLWLDSGNQVARLVAISGWDTAVLAYSSILPKSKILCLQKILDQKVNCRPPMKLT